MNVAESEINKLDLINSNVEFPYKISAGLFFIIFLITAIFLHIISLQTDVIISTSSGQIWIVSCRNKSQTLELSANLHTQIHNIFNSSKNSSVLAFKNSKHLSTADEVIKLKALLDQGALTQEEFSNEKKKALSKAA